MIGIILLFSGQVIEICILWIFFLMGQIIIVFGNGAKEFFSCRSLVSTHLIQRKMLKLSYVISKRILKGKQKHILLYFLSCTVYAFQSAIIGGVLYTFEMLLVSP